ncbi:unnamed protein product [Symbiodinium microadriaticum]|uniref:DUF2336 domain-containing protein n=1 Tax=Pelagibius sp. TaxID=1931238 RepID=UPI001A39E36E|nr:unnamed protein product [Symbiodinium microadriaticum]
MTGHLSQSDVARLMADPSPSVRAETTSKIAAQYDRKHPRMTDAERKIAEEIFRKLAQDAETRVREALAANLKTTADLPHDIALSLAQDVDSVALPVLKFSDVLTDDDLIAIVRGEDAEAKQVAIAQRQNVSGAVADALIDTGNETAVARLVANEGAELSEDALGRVISDYDESAAVSDSLARRSQLPASISEQLVAAMADKLQDYLVSKHNLSSDAASNLILQTRERATVSLLSRGSSDEELEELVFQLHVNGRLTASLIMRALCVGDLSFFEAAMARLANVPLKNARMLIHDEGDLGLRSIYQKAKMPPRLLAAVNTAVNILEEEDYDGGRNDRERFVSRVIERLLTQFEDPSSTMTQDDIDYLMSKLHQLAA